MGVPKKQHKDSRCSSVLSNFDFKKRVDSRLSQRGCGFRVNHRCAAALNCEDASNNLWTTGAADVN
jgi:hypothetical protein